MKLLIVDDSDLLQDRLYHAIADADKTICMAQAYSFKEGLVMFSTFEPDKVILDIALPDGSGINLLQIFKKDKPSVKVIIFTNYPTSEFKKSCMELGADHFFDKSNLGRILKYVNENSYD
jgi:YesN/AraC family two-component response regulator